MDHRSRNSWVRAGTGLLIGVALGAGSLQAQTRETAKLEVGENLFQDFFGRAVGVNEEYAIVGEPNDVHDLRPPLQDGACFVFRRTPEGWLLQQQLRASDALDSWLQGSAMFFGSRLALGDDVLVVGDLGNADGALQRGAAYVYELRDGRWMETQKLLSDLNRRKEQFGGGLAVDGDRILVGAAGDDERGLDHGAVYVYERGDSGWVKVAKLFAEGPSVAVGLRVALKGDVAVATSIEEKAYVFEKIDGQWRQRAVLVDPLAVDWQDEFGWGLAVDDGVIAVGEPVQVLPDVTRPGSVVLFERDGAGEWGFVEKIHAPDYEIHPKNGTDFFGGAVALRGKHLLVGAVREADLNGDFVGQAYLFKRKPKGWKPVDRFTAGGKGKGGQLGLGSAVAVSDSFILVGDDVGIGKTKGVHSGAAYVYERPLGKPVCDAVPNSTGQPAALTVHGSLASHVGALDLHAVGLPRNELGLFLVSRSEGFVPNPGGSDGNLCLGRPIGRFADGLASSGDEGRLDYVVDTGHVPVGTGAPIQPGETWLFQGWFTERRAGQGSNFTEARSVTFD